MSVRTSRLLRPRNVVLMAGVLLLAWGGWTFYGLMTLEPGEPVDYAPEMAALMERYHGAGEEGSNGWRYLEEAAQIVEALKAEVSAAGGPPLAIGLVADPTPARTPEEMAVARRQEEVGFWGVEQLRERGAFGRLAAAAHAPRAMRPVAVGELGFGPSLDIITHLRVLARAANVRMTVAAINNDSEDLVNTFEATLGLGRILCEQGSVIDHLSGWSIAMVAYDCARTIVSDRWASYETLRGLQAALDRQALPPAEFTVEVSRLESLAMLQAFFTDTGGGDGRLIVSLVPGPLLESLDEGSIARMLAAGPVPDLANLLFAGKAETVARLEEFYRGASERAALPRWERADRPFDPYAFAGGLSDRHVLLRNLLEGKTMTFAVQDHMQVRLAGLRTLIGIELYRRWTGQYPSVLEELVPSMVSELPLDPYTGRPLCYRRLGRDPHGRDYLLYSPGADGVDDGGRVHPEMNQRALNVSSSDGAPAAPGYDYIVNEPREPEEERFWERVGSYADPDR